VLHDYYLTSNGNRIDVRRDDADAVHKTITIIMDAVIAKLVCSCAGFQTLDPGAAETDDNARRGEINILPIHHEEAEAVPFTNDVKILAQHFITLEESWSGLTRIHALALASPISSSSIMDPSPPNNQNGSTVSSSSSNCRSASS
jgi:hypothetical protein